MYSFEHIDISPTLTPRQVLEQMFVTLDRSVTQIEKVLPHVHDITDQSQEKAVFSQLAQSGVQILAFVTAIMAYLRARREQQDSEPQQNVAEILAELGHRLREGASPLSGTAEACAQLVLSPKQFAQMQRRIETSGRVIIEVFRTSQQRWFMQKENAVTKHNGKDAHTHQEGKRSSESQLNIENMTEVTQAPEYRASLFCEVLLFAVIRKLRDCS